MVNENESESANSSDLEFIDLIHEAHKNFCSRFQSLLKKKIKLMNSYFREI